MIFTKETLYRQVERFRRKKELPLPFDPMAFCRANPQIRLRTVPFKTPGLCGVAVPAGPGQAQPHLILLNQSRSYVQQKFDCAHEMMHLLLHRRAQAFQCLEQALQPDGSREWQANEAAAELLVPYQAFLPLLYEKREYLTSDYGTCQVKLELAAVFGVTPAIIHFRLESLKWEIEQFFNGVPLAALTLCSRTALQRAKRQVYSLNQVTAAELVRRKAMPVFDRPEEEAYR